MTPSRHRDPWVQEMPSVGELFPTGTRRLSYRPGRSPALLVLPSRRSPRMLVPSEVSTAGSMLHRHSTSRLQRLGQDALALALRSRVLPMLPVARLVPGGAVGGATIEEHVRRHVPGAAHVGVLLGPPRANAKPVLRVFDAAGRTVAFGKVGHDVLSARLVRAEADVLRELGGHAFDELELPRVLYAGTWRGLEVLYMTPLSQAGQRETSWELPLAAMRELATASVQATSPSPAGASGYVAGLRARVAAAAPQAGLAAVLDDVLALVGDVALCYGRWHGDWAPWNCRGEAGGRLQLWDWERSTAAVPLGFDAVHFLLQREFRDGSTPARAATTLLPAAGQALVEFGVRGRQVPATVVLYLVEILQRYSGDPGTRPTPALQHRLGTVHALIATLCAQLANDGQA